ncbi:MULTISPECIES: glycosyltransferase family 1 protein [Paraburkholderia]|uniref:Glycosyltransferase family 1 protein n=1 Tax=Paraburkholderia madseniana TaxID=2599607 RepID=A0AAP5BIP8_9BURK|nr:MULTISPECIES: glycosyltransferase family 1 protein [Paraburkholderia]MCX4149420.1 glycosyltransferase family 1 protein [Paraburkholderia madseniana]MDN7152355.1 glycosyltransferase family 4 protein [Paraburkholderia sp. WS6]MDQ6411237.1 glycosyltransferase family 4 protein [Paraburkholderia madseniana]
MIKVAFVFGFRNENWLGGINYYRNLISAIKSLPDRKIEPVILTGTRGSEDLLRDFPQLEVVKTTLLDRRHPSWFCRKLLYRATGRDIVFEKFLIKNGVSVLSHHHPLGRRARVPVMGWIPDFQHKHLPELFSETELKSREKWNGEIASQCSRVIVSSDHARKDLEKYFRVEAQRISVLKFVANYPKNLDLLDRAALEEKFSFAGEYFHLPNQFWQHKNHEIVVDALKILKDKGRKVIVLATGSVSDYRNKDHFNWLCKRIGEAGVGDGFRILGVVSYSDLVSLMVHAAAVINPSRFEGWSTTVEEAKTLDKTIILSRIEVHQEQAPKNALYFDPKNASELADCISKTLSCNFREKSDKPPLNEMANSNNLARRIAFAKEFQEAVLAAAYP